MRDIGWKIANALLGSGRLLDLVIWAAESTKTFKDAFTRTERALETAPPAPKPPPPVRQRVIGRDLLRLAGYGDCDFACSHERETCVSRVCIDDQEVLFAAEIECCVRCAVDQLENGGCYCGKCGGLVLPGDPVALLKQATAEDEESVYAHAGADGCIDPERACGRWGRRGHVPPRAFFGGSHDVLLAQVATLRS